MPAKQSRAILEGLNCSRFRGRYVGRFRSPYNRFSIDRPRQWPGSRLYEEIKIDGNEICIKMRICARAGPFTRVAARTRHYL